MTQVKITALVLLAFLVLPRSAASVEDLTGVYDVGISCKAIQAGVRGKLKESSEIDVFDDGLGTVLINWPGFFEFRTFLVPENAKPGRGSLAGVNCPLTIDTLDGATLAVDVKTKPGSDAASFKGTLIVQRSDQAQVFNCKVKGKRVSSQISKFSFCLPAQ